MPAQQKKQQRNHLKGLRCDINILFWGIEMAASEGVDLEWAIVDYIRISNGSLLAPTRQYSDKIQKQAIKCAEHVMDFAGKKKVEAWHSDDNTNPFHVSISAKPEPKTDVIFKIGNSVYTASVKMAGPVQLASGQGESTADLFEAAGEHLSNKVKSKVLLSIISELRTMPTRLLSESNKPRILSEGKQKVIEEFIKNGKVITDKSYDYWLKNNKPLLMDKLLTYVENDKDFKLALLYEAMTGEKTLAKYKGAVANSIISPKGFYEIDHTYVKSIFDKVKFDIRGKSRSGITGIAFRIDVK
jgi:hypothetical protein